MSLSSDIIVEKTSSKANSTLRDLGFGVHETAVILALINYESATVAELHSDTGIHHANLYAVLNSLIDKGLVVLNQGRPKKYQLTPLNHIEELISSKVEQLIHDLKVLQQSRISQGVMPALIYTIRGNSDVFAKMLALMGKAEISIFLAAPDLDLLGMMFYEHLQKAKSRGIQIRAILGKKPNEPIKEIQYRIRHDTLAINLVIDSKESLISMPDLRVCGWADNAIISAQLQGFLEQSWKLSKKE